MRQPPDTATHVDTDCAPTEMAFSITAPTADNPATAAPLVT